MSNRINQILAEPEPLEIDWSRSAVAVIDMQNAFVSPGGMFDLRGFDLTQNQRIINPIKKICEVARENGIKIIYVVHLLSPDLQEVGPESTFWYKSVKTYREDLQWSDKFIIRGTWGAQIVDPLMPEKDDIIIEKPRFSAFFASHLDLILKRLNIKYLFFVGCATNICVESSIRDAANLGYFPILVVDATTNNGPSFMQDATVFNVKLCFGWVTHTENIFNSLE